MEALRLALFVFVFEIIGLPIIWMLYCLATGKKHLIAVKIKGCLDIVKYVGQYWFDVFCIIIYGISLAGKATIRFFWIVGIIVCDTCRKIGFAARATVEIINLIIKLSKQRHANKKVAFYQKAAETFQTSEYSNFESEKYA